MTKPVKIYMGIPSTGQRSDTQTYALREAEEKYKGQVELVYPKQAVHRMFHDYARNEIVEEFLKSDCDILWFLDSDIVPVPEVLDLCTIHLEKWVAGGACYPIFMKIPGTSEDSQPVIQFTAYKGIVDGVGIGLSAVPRQGQDYLDGLATGCLFIKREVFSALQKPYFEFKYNPETRAMTEGEDLGFCMKLNALGIKFFTDYSWAAKHYKTVCLMQVNNYAISHANNQLLAYDKQIRGQVESLVSRVVPKRTSSLILP